MLVLHLQNFLQCSLPEPTHSQPTTHQVDSCQQCIDTHSLTHTHALCVPWPRSAELAVASFLCRGVLIQWLKDMASFSLIWTVVSGQNSPGKTWWNIKSLIERHLKEHHGSLNTPAPFPPGDSRLAQTGWHLIPKINVRTHKWMNG